MRAGVNTELQESMQFLSLVVLPAPGIKKRGVHVIMRDYPLEGIPRYTEISKVSLGMAFVLDNSAAHNLHPVPKFILCP